MKRNLSKLGNPIFLCCIFLLLLNDFLLKVTFYNTFTGKLSDFVGLFAFPYFFSVFYPKYKKHIHGLTIIGFVFWKSAFSQPLIDALNAIHIPINRMVDFTDNIALSSIFISYYIFNQNRIYKLRLVFIRGLTILSLFAFCATTVFHPEGMAKLDEKYDFNLSNKELIREINELQMYYFYENDRRNYSYLRYIHDTIILDNERNIFHYPDYEEDTLGIFINLDDVKISDTIKYRAKYFQFDVYATSDTTSQLHLLGLYFMARKFKDRHIERVIRKNSKIFKRKVVNKIKVDEE